MLRPLQKILKCVFERKEEKCWLQTVLNDNDKGKLVTRKPAYSRTQMQQVMSDLQDFEGQG
jgi:hypothetical protein